ncbi:MAG: hypothetical protein HKO65_20595 [Gemmatimonadetes bacterium]|nr:hypothetical protein [Gemmatimonadota bacterium]
MTHRSEDWGFQVSHPVHWRVVIASKGHRSGGWEAEILSDEEIYKVTFLEPETQTWPGRYEVRLLANPSGQDLDAVISRFDLSDLWEDQPTDTVLAGQPAKTWVRWRADSLTREFLLVLPRGIAHLRFAESTPNDPALLEHKKIYAAMTESLSIGIVR